MIAFNCAGCGKSFSVKDEFAGRETRCPKCGATLRVPAFTSTGATVQTPAAPINLRPQPSPVVQAYPPPLVTAEVLPSPPGAQGKGANTKKRLIIAASVGGGVLLTAIIVLLIVFGGGLPGPLFSSKGDGKRSFSYGGMLFSYAATHENSLTISVTGKPSDEQDMIMVLIAPSGERREAGNIDKEFRRSLNIHGECHLGASFFPLKAGDYTLTLKSSDGSQELCRKTISITDGKPTIEGAEFHFVERNHGGDVNIDVDSMQLVLVVEGDIPIRLDECRLFEKKCNMKGIPKGKRSFGAGRHLITINVYYDGFGIDRPYWRFGEDFQPTVSLSYTQGSALGGATTKEATGVQTIEYQAAKVPAEAKRG